MQEYIRIAVEAVIGIAAAGTVAIVVANVRWIGQSRRVLEEVVSNQNEQKVLIGHLLRDQPSFRQALRASLETLRDGKCNGNVAKALEMLEESDVKHQDILVSMANGERHG